MSLVLDPAERYNLGFFLACLCTPLVGEDVARWLPRYRPTRRLARDAFGDIAAVLGRARSDLDQGRDTRKLCRSVTRKLVRADSPS